MDASLLMVSLGVFAGFRNRRATTLRRKKQGVDILGTATSTVTCFNCGKEKLQPAVAHHPWKRKESFARCKECSGIKIHNFRSSRRRKVNEKSSGLNFTMAGEDELLSMGSKLEVELDCPGGPNKVYWGRRSGRLRTRNWGYTQHIDAVWSMKCFKELIKLDVFPDAKDISESMGALRAATLYSHLSLRKDAEKSRRDALRSRWKEENVWCICIGDGSTPRTATLISFLTVWNLFSIDPGLKKEFVGKEPKGIQRLEAFDLKFEDWAKMYSKSADCQRIKSMCKYLFIICVHSHHRFVGEASFDKIRDAFGNCPTCLVNLPCCAKFRPTKDLGITPALTYDDPAIFSACRQIDIWHF